MLQSRFEDSVSGYVDNLNLCFLIFGWQYSLIGVGWNSSFVVSFTRHTLNINTAQYFEINNVIQSIFISKIWLISAQVMLILNVRSCCSFKYCIFGSFEKHKQCTWVLASSSITSFVGTDCCDPYLLYIVSAQFHSQIIRNFKNYWTFNIIYLASIFSSKFTITYDYFHVW